MKEPFKTTMQELIDFCMANYGVDSDVSNNIVGKARTLKIKEKQQIINAFELGNDLGHKGRLPNGEGYYNNKFKRQ